MKIVGMLKTMLQSEKYPAGRSRWLTKLDNHFIDYPVYKKCMSLDQSAMGYEKRIKQNVWGL